MPVYRLRVSRLQMGSIYLVRHGQAAFGTADYDRLTPMGKKQCHHLGAYLARNQLRIDALYCGALTRHRQSLEALVEGYETTGRRAAAGAAEIFPALNEYNPEAVMAAFGGVRIGPNEAAEARDPTVVRQHFRLLRAALVAWANGATTPAGMPSFMEFQLQANEVLRLARERHTDGNVVIVSSGGPIGAIVAAVLESPPATAVELNLRIRNASLTEFATNAKRHNLVMFNSVAHLEADADLISYA